jgi:hypothetical protein
VLAGPVGRTSAIRLSMLSAVVGTQPPVTCW